MSTYMKEVNQVVIFDSSGLVALVKQDDALHNDALGITKFIELNDWQVLLPYEALSETLNILGKILGRKDALKVGNSLLEQYNDHVVSFIQSEAHIVSHALSILESASGSPSFTDCLVMAQANEQKTSYIFGFDATFQKNGFILPG